MQIFKDKCIDCKFFINCPAPEFNEEQEQSLVAKRISKLLENPKFRFAYDMDKSQYSPSTFQRRLEVHPDPNDQHFPNRFGYSEFEADCVSADIMANIMSANIQGAIALVNIYDPILIACCYHGRLVHYLAKYPEILDSELKEIDSIMKMFK